MISNIEPIAREITRGICRDSEMQETHIEQWVYLHWECAVAMLEADVTDETGEWIEGKDWRRGSEAYRERLLALPASEAAAVEHNSTPIIKNGDFTMLIAIDRFLPAKSPK
jgi:hypothetical protein